MAQKLVLPVRFTTRGEAVQTTTREIDLSGAFVRCVDAPPVGAELVLELQLPGDEPAVVAGKVESRSGGPVDAGFYARFVDPDPQFTFRVRQALGGKKPSPASLGPGAEPGVGRNRRTTSRYLGKLVVKLGGRGIAPGVFALDLSQTGLFVLMPNPPEVDEMLQLELELPDKLPPSSVLGLVVRRVGLPDSGPGKPAGAGLVFVSGDDGFRKRYDTYLATLKGARK
jgi:PilZ domain